MGTRQPTRAASLGLSANSLAGTTRPLLRAGRVAVQVYVCVCVCLSTYAGSGPSGAINIRRRRHSGTVFFLCFSRRRRNDDSLEIYVIDRSSMGRNIVLEEIPRRKNKRPHEIV